jgi:hypothetical protein
MVGAFFTDTGNSITSWGWRGDRRLWHVDYREDLGDQVEYLSYECDAVEALLEFLGRVDVYTEGFDRYTVRYGCG